MSCDGSVTTRRTSVDAGWLLAPLFLYLCEHLLPVALKSACVPLPIPCEVGFDTCCLRRTHPSSVARRSYNTCGVALWCHLFGSTPLRTPHLRFWSRMYDAKGQRGIGVMCLQLSSFGNNASSPDGCLMRKSTLVHRRGHATWLSTCYLVVHTISHMLVSKTKSCMHKYELIWSGIANGSLNQL